MDVSYFCYQRLQDRVCLLEVLLPPCVFKCHRICGTLIKYDNADSDACIYGKKKTQVTEKHIICLYPGKVLEKLIAYLVQSIGIFAVSGPVRDLPFISKMITRVMNKTCSELVDTQPCLLRQSEV